MFLFSKLKYAMFCLIIGKYYATTKKLTACQIPTFIIDKLVSYYVQSIVNSHILMYI